MIEVTAAHFHAVMSQGRWHTGADRSQSRLSSNTPKETAKCVPTIGRRLLSSSLTSNLIQNLIEST